MKTPIVIATLGLTGLALGLGIDWSTIDGGGGTSSGGIYSVRGTIGQPDAGVMTGGSYTLLGGYWSTPEILPSPGGPALSMTRNGANAILTWPAPSPGWVLEKSADLIVWTLVTTPPVIAGGNKSVTLAVSPNRECYRLRLQ